MRDMKYKQTFLLQVFRETNELPFFFLLERSNFSMNEEEPNLFVTSFTK